MSGEGVESQLFAKCGYLWPSSFLSSLPVSTSHSRIVLSLDPLTSRVGFDGSKLTQFTALLPFSQMSVLLVLLYASPPLNLRLSPGDRANTNAKCCHLWPFRHKIFAPVCVQMRWMRPSESPAAMTSPAGPYCTLQICESKRAVSHPLAPW